MSINANSFELDSFINQKICSCYDSDCHVPDFFSIIQQEKPDEDELTKKKYCANEDAYECVVPDSNNDKAEKNNQSRFYNDHPYIAKESIFFDKYEYPDDVKNAIDNVNSLERIFLGYFTLADFFYCSYDKNIVLFNTEGTVYKISDDNYNIISCDAALPDKFIYETKNVKFLLIYSTENSVSVIPIGKNYIYDKTKITSIRTSFIPTIIKVYPTETSSNIFIGSNTGDVYGLFYKYNQAKAKIDITIQNLSSNIFLSLIPKFLRYTHQIINICFDSTTNFLAAIDSLSNIRFFKYSAKDKKLTEVSRYDSQIEGANKEKIVSINEIPISDSENTRFVCVTESGKRLFFGTNTGSYPNDQIILLQQVFVPKDLVNLQLISGGYFLNTSIFVYPNFIVVFHPYYDPHQPPIRPKEFFDVLDFHDPQPISIIVPNHKYQNQTFRLFYHELMWEHIEGPSVCYLMCAESYYKLTFSRPVDVLLKLIMESKGHFSNSIRDWMSYYGEDAESAATLLLLASEYMEKEEMKEKNEKSSTDNSSLKVKRDKEIKSLEVRWALTILYQYSTMKINQAFPSDSFQLLSISNANNINSLSPTCAGFVQRASKLLSLFWQTPVFTNNSNDQYCLSPIFRKLPPNLKKQLENLITLSIAYTNKKRTLDSSQTKTPYQRKEESDESILFEKLREYLEKIIDIIKFIEVVSKQSSFIDRAFKNLEPKAQERLSIESFGSEIQQMSLYDALREFAASLYVIDSNIYQLLYKECSNFLSIEDREIIDATNNLGKQPCDHSLREEARDIYLKYIRQPFKLDKIVELFSMGDEKYSKGIIDICLSKASANDPKQIALEWYNGGRSKLDYRGRYYFDKRYECYEFIFQLIERENYKGIEQLLKSNDEIFHICLYHRMLTKDHIKDLLTISSKYIESFLEEYAPDHLWIYYSAQNNYAKSADKLNKMINDPNKDFELYKRKKWLLYVSQLASASKQNELKNEAIVKYKLAEIQDMLRQRTTRNMQNDDLNKKLLSSNELFNRCCEELQWDLVLNILSFSSTSGLIKSSIISKAWSNYFQRNLWNESLGEAAKSIENTCLFNKYMPNNEVCNPSITLPVFEEHRLRKKGDALWAVITMINASFDKHLILKAYLDALENPDISQDVRFDFSYAAAYLFSKGANPRGRDMTKMKEYFLSKATRCKYYQEAAEKMKFIV
ncbi:hypothetical protein M9Y10_025436 [Tritrichomonas musculus]|uniref:Nucleoporin Nup133/Nup155-like C-terminal domain-containing protein n=1 Tax=Tritrichomonas musculus TaxID=1915356 RepID=A0ABR2H8N7_9EUKA